MISLTANRIMFADLWFHWLQTELFFKIFHIKMFHSQFLICYCITTGATIHILVQPFISLSNKFNFSRKYISFGLNTRSLSKEGLPWELEISDCCADSYEEYKKLRGTRPHIEVCVPIAMSSACLSHTQLFFYLITKIGYAPRFRIPFTLQTKLLFCI